MTPAAVTAGDGGRGRRQGLRRFAPHGARTRRPHQQPRPAGMLLARANRTSLNVEGAYRHIITDLYGFIG
ncbi:hypothetical protein, partial [Dermacoccus nishinomiyaensis]|uniref:hypothetical protein n=1 Tax=Dermacoccus nishinomiyaensis TaxID=1274 RepID=UPI0033AFA4B0